MSRINWTAAALAAVLVLYGCQFLSGPRLPVSEAAVIDLGSQAAAAAVREGKVEVIVSVPGADGASGKVSVITSSGVDPRGTVNLLSYGGETNEEWNTFVYGNAPPTIAKVELDLPGGIGGEVVDGAWLIVLRERDVTPDNLHWRFIGADGLAVREGDGLLTAGTQ